MQVSKKALNDLDLSHLKEYVKWAPTSEYFDKPAGDEYYRLLAYISSQLPAGNNIVDIGTYHGLSACALAFNADCTVKTYDIFDHLSDNPEVVTIKNMPNVDFVIKDCLQDDEVLKKAKVIVLDVDPHDGQQETEILAKLRAVGFNGLLIVDDIKLNQGMKQFWTEIPERKMDVTEYGHWSGTGIVFFSDEWNISFV